MSRQLIPQEMRGCFIDDKVDNLSNLYFKWKVDLIDIHRLRPNFEIGSLVGRNL
jgi:hypothetical protein